MVAMLAGFFIGYQISSEKPTEQNLYTVSPLSGKELLSQPVSLHDSNFDSRFESRSIDSKNVDEFLEHSKLVLAGFSNINPACGVETENQHGLTYQKERSLELYREAQFLLEELEKENRQELLPLVQKIRDVLLTVAAIEALNKRETLESVLAEADMTVCDITTYSQH
jgi:hypothetical protein